MRGTISTRITRRTRARPSGSGVLRAAHRLHAFARHIREDLAGAIRHRAAARYSAEDPDFVRIYIDCTTQGLAPLTARLSRSIESIAAQAYRRLLADAQQKGEIDASLDPAIAAFCLDNLLC